MADDHHPANGHSPSERTPLLKPIDGPPQSRLLTDVQHGELISIADSHLSKDEQALGSSAVGERLPYNDYTTIDWLHDLVKDSYRFRLIRNGKSIRQRLFASFDAASGWIAAAIIGTLTACVAFCVDVVEALVSDLKLGYCTRNVLLDRGGCCKGKTPLLAMSSIHGAAEDCAAWHEWTDGYWETFAIYGAFALAFGIISAAVTTFSKRALPGIAPGHGHGHGHDGNGNGNGIDLKPAKVGKVMYMASGSGIPEIKTILGGFVIPGYLSFRVLVIKAVGATFAVATGMCLGKEGPFVHISGCVGYLVAMRFPKYRDNGRKLREMLSAAVAAGLAVAFGAPIGGVLFTYEEISTYFPRKVLWRAFLCALFAAVVLKALNPIGTGKLVLFETNYGTSYGPKDYLIFIVLGIAGGLWGGLFCRLNFLWSKWFRSFSIIKKYSILEVSLVVLVTVLLQYPNPLIREPGDISIRNLLGDCKDPAGQDSYICQNEKRSGVNANYIASLALGCLTKLVLTIVTFGIKVPSGIIIPALNAGALFGRLIGQLVGDISPGIFAMVGAAAFLAGVSRMTISLCVVMFELTGELEYILPHMIAILIAKWVADSLSREGVYDLAQSVLGHPFLDPDQSTHLVQSQTRAHLVGRLIPPKQTMKEIRINVPPTNKVKRRILEQKLEQLQARGLMDAGLVLVQNDICQGYLAQGELEFGLAELGKLYPSDCEVRVLGDSIDLDPSNIPGMDVEVNGTNTSDPLSDALDLSAFVDRTPLSLPETAPMEYAMECFGKLGLRHMMVTEEGTGKLKGVIIKKRLVQYIETLVHEE